MSCTTVNLKKNFTKSKITLLIEINEVLATFSEEKWKKLLDDRDKHTMFDYKGCFKSKTLKIALSKFPIKSKVYRSKARNAGFLKETELKEVTKTIISNLDKSFQSTYRTTFTVQIKEILTYLHKHLPRKSRSIQ